jgi:hypothetical protein
MRPLRRGILSLPLLLGFSGYSPDTKWIDMTAVVFDRVCGFGLPLLSLKARPS